MEEDDQLRRSQRDRKFPEKAAEFTLKTKLKNTKICYRILSTLSNNFHKLFLLEKDLFNQHTVNDLISMKNSYFHMIKFKHGFLKVTVLKKRDEKLMMLWESVKDWILKHSKVFFCGQEVFDIREKVSILKAIIR